MGHVVNPNLYRLKYVLPFNIICVTKNKYSDFFDLKIQTIQNFVRLYFFNYNKSIFNRPLFYIINIKIVLKFYNFIAYLNLKQSRYFKKRNKRKIRKLKRLHFKLIKKSNLLKQSKLKKFDKNNYSFSLLIKSKFFFFKKFYKTKVFLNKIKLKRKKTLLKKNFVKKKLLNKTKVYRIGQYKVKKATRWKINYNYSIQLGEHKKKLTKKDISKKIKRMRGLLKYHFYKTTALKRFFFYKNLKLKKVDKKYFFVFKNARIRTKFKKKRNVKKKRFFRKFNLNYFFKNEKANIKFKKKRNVKHTVFLKNFTKKNSSNYSNFTSNVKKIFYKYSKRKIRSISPGYAKFLRYKKAQRTILNYKNKYFKKKTKFFIKKFKSNFNKYSFIPYFPNVFKKRIAKHQKMKYFFKKKSRIKYKIPKLSFKIVKIFACKKKYRNKFINLLEGSSKKLKKLKKKLITSEKNVSNRYLRWRKHTFKKNFVKYSLKKFYRKKKEVIPKQFKIISQFPKFYEMAKKIKAEQDLYIERLRERNRKMFGTDFERKNLKVSRLKYKNSVKKRSLNFYTKFINYNKKYYPTKNKKKIFSWRIKRIFKRMAKHSKFSTKRKKKKIIKKVKFNSFLCLKNVKRKTFILKKKHYNLRLIRFICNSFIYKKKSVPLTFSKLFFKKPKESRIHAQRVLRNIYLKKLQSKKHNNKISKNKLKNKNIKSKPKKQVKKTRYKSLENGLFSNKKFSKSKFAFFFKNKFKKVNLKFVSRFYKKYKIKSNFDLKNKKMTLGRRRRWRKVKSFKKFLFLFKNFMLFKLFYFKYTFIKAINKFLEFRSIINIFFIIRKFWNYIKTADMFSEAIILRLLKRNRIKSIIRSVIFYFNNYFRKKKIGGYSIIFSGRFTRKDRAMYAWYKRGSYSRSNRIVMLDYSNRRVALKYSSCSFKISLIKYYYKNFV